MERDAAKSFQQGRKRPIARHWKGLSGDRQGHEISAVLGRILDTGFRKKEPLGKDVENSAIYVWPYLATLDLDSSSPAQDHLHH